MTVMKAVGFANGKHCPHAGQYLEFFDFDRFDGEGFGQFTKDRSKALTFANPGEALKFWKTTSKVRPRRPDGKPNRPLTALSVTLED